MPRASMDLAAWKTTLLCMVPPKRGWGWQTTAASGGGVAAVGSPEDGFEAADRAGRKKFRESWRWAMGGECWMTEKLEPNGD